MPIIVEYEANDALRENENLCLWLPVKSVSYYSGVPIEAWEGGREEKWEGG